VHVCATPIERLEGRGGKLQHVVLSNGERWARTVLFFSNGHSLQCTLPVELGCRTARGGEVITDSKQRTGLAGLFVAGDASIDTHFISVACAEGAKAAVAIHVELRKDDGLA
jgi:thioredoxin reductase